LIHEAQSSHVQPHLLAERHQEGCSVLIVGCRLRSLYLEIRAETIERRSSLRGVVSSREPGERKQEEA
jgi:hypothetical protein